MTARRAFLLAAIVAAGALAGCAGDDTPAGASEPVTKGSSGSPTSTVVDLPPPRPKGTSERWHFHDYWKGNPTITLLEQDVNLTASQGADGLPALSAIVSLPHGVIVPPETGFLTVNVTWAGATEGLVNLTYKPADSNDFFHAGEIGRLEGAVINTTESNADVPHRQVSAWRFNLSARPGGTPPAMPPQTLHLVVNATIGRPLFIDPPHLNWWQDNDTIPLVVGANGTFAGGRVAQVGNVTAPSLPTLGAPSVPPSSPSVPTASSLSAPHRVPVDSGRIVPEGAHSIVAVLTWTSAAPGAKLALEYAEQNFPSAGPMEVATDGATMRVFSLKVAQAQTDTTYSNRTTWEFHVVPEGDPGAFQGDYTLVAWASQLEPAEAVAALASRSG